MAAGAGTYAELRALLGRRSCIRCRSGLVRTGRGARRAVRDRLPRAVSMRANAQPGETVLVHGATGGVGIAAVRARARARHARHRQRRHRARDSQTVRADRRRRRREPSRAGYLDEIMRATGGRGVDVDHRDGRAHQSRQAISSLLRQHGRVVVVGNRGPGRDRRAAGDGTRRGDPRDDAVQRHGNRTRVDSRGARRRTRQRHAESARRPGNSAGRCGAGARSGDGAGRASARSSLSVACTVRTEPPMKRLKLALSVRASPARPSRSRSPDWWRRRGPHRQLPRQQSRGKAVYDAHCVECHGITGQGDGPAAAFLTPQAARLHLRQIQDPNDRNRQHPDRRRPDAIGPAGPLGTAMPGWRGLLSDADIERGRSRTSNRCLRGSRTSSPGRSSKLPPAPADARQHLARPPRRTRSCMRGSATAPTGAARARSRPSSRTTGSSRCTPPT